MPALRSRLISNANYDAATNVLTITFADTGRMYDFFAVPPSIYEGLLHAPSAGTYLNAVLKPRFRAVRRRRVRPAAA
ncbi:MAG: KTSC domain-containing protein [Bauldia sp.]